MTVTREVSASAEAPVKPARKWTQRDDSERARRAQETRQALITAARQLFTEHGYHAVGVRDFGTLAGVTRGALYHHFGDKERLFLAVFNAVEEDLQAELAERAKKQRGNTWQRLRSNVQAYLEAATRPDVQRITLIDGPAVLGWQRWRQLEDTYSLGALTGALKAAMDAKLIRVQPVEPLAHVLLGSIIEAALLLAHSEDPVKRRAELGKALDGFLRGLE